MVVKLKIFVAIASIICLANFSCAQKKSQPSVPESPQTIPAESKAPIAAAERFDAYLPQLQGKRIGAVVNHTSMLGETHLVDTLLKLGIRIEKIFAPEHGFRGTADAGEHVRDGRDAATGIPLVSLYGSKKKPGKAELEGLDLVLFDIQDVGARFYTYISTMSYVMEACAEQGLPMLVLDRPNPNGHYVDGPVLQKTYSSFVGLHEVPVVHGMTVGEYARMVNGEGWLAGGIQCSLTVIPCENYDHTIRYELPVKPSPNLPNMRAIYLYPSICFFEGTEVSVGRGTDKQFQVLGSPGFSGGDFTFTPRPMEGAKNPPFEGKVCHGFDLTTLTTEDLARQNAIDLSYLITFYQGFDKKESFFLKNLFFDKLAGGPDLRQQIIAGKSETEIRESWQSGLEQFKTIRSKYLLYPDF